MKKLEKLLNDTIKSEYENTEEFAQYIELYIDSDNIILSFLKKQHVEEFLKFHHHLIEDYNIQIKIKKMKVGNIRYLGRDEDSGIKGSIIFKQNHVDVEVHDQVNEILDDIQSYIGVKVSQVHKESSAAKEYGGDWMMPMNKIAPLIDVYHFINDKKKKLRYDIKE